MSAPTERNRLDEEESPYLRQHADNPVNWQPWDEQALEAARERDVPIFLSVGYSACHWCHVMEEESFEDEEIARSLNENFVPIKVDREERPDLDSIYQTVCQLVSGRGGWPLSAWLTPEGKPFYVGTYFPKEEKRGMPGFGTLLDNIANSWETDRDEMENRAQQWTDAAKDRLEETPGAGGDAPGSEFLETAADAVLRGADRQHGGFGSGGPKFPQPQRIELLFRAYDRTGRETYLEVAEETLDAMADGGMYDHVGGGFHRYATDREWTVPHFEKMLYDNAELPRAYLAGYQVTGNERYAEVARETVAFVERELTLPEGGFYSTLDAQSPIPESRGEDAGEDEEGEFYVWTPEEVREVLDDETADIVCERYGITPSGNFERGRSVPTVSESVDAIAESYDLDPDAVEKRLDAALDELFDARADRPRPRRDEKVLAGWNGLMIAALAEAGIVLDEEYATLAEDALSFVREHLWDEGSGRLNRRYKDGDVKGDGYLEDYAFLGRGAFVLYEATGDVQYLRFALDLARAVEDEFWDDEAETLYYTPESGEELVTRPQELRDQSTPSSVGVAVDLLLTLGHFVPDESFREVAEAVVGTHGDRVRASPVEYPSLAMAADRAETGGLELTVVADEAPEAWRTRFADEYLPNRILARRPPTAGGLREWLDDLGLDDAPPIWANREADADEPTLYVCRSFTCSPPQTDVDEAMGWAEDLAPSASDDSGADGSEK
ncbi:thioredoxin domain-containing protein [Halostella sp. JP-L12]|uniref:thioredoxin domain-containing protein n=1 Tax=Halostella TaxID=1843185 RepID=UPI000EF8110F|nr:MULTISPECIES: thioredoxin domain-containing protein [Halostella]NHN48824.1 thioredoxin domain-containing protein [Halostella sp. JP-L12]